MTRCVTVWAAGSTTRPFSSPGNPSRHTAAVPIASVTSAMAAFCIRETLGANLLGAALGHGRKGPPGRFRMCGLLRVAAERVEDHGAGAERAELFQVAGDLLDRAVADQPVLAGDRRRGEVQRDPRRQRGR